MGGPNLDRIADEAGDLLRRNVDLWFPRCRAAIGFHQAFARNWSPIPEETRFLVFQGRMVWVAANAAEAIPERSEALLEMVDHGRRAMAELLLDAVHGGYWWSVDLSGRPIGNRPEVKIAYGLAFALYSLSAAARVVGDSDSRAEADAVFEFLERLHDSEHGGYHESALPDGTPLAKREPDARGTEFGPSGGASLKSQNTHLHLLEALLEYRRISRNPIAQARIDELVELFSGAMLADPGVHRPRFRSDWTPIEVRWEIGHDLEAAYLLLLASDSDRAELAARKLIEFNLEHGFDRRNGGCFAGSPRPGEAVDRTKVWWIQAEAINGLLFALRRFPDMSFRVEVELEELWDWFRGPQWDAQYGGFFARMDEGGHVLGDGAKADPWKACYHDMRALLNLVQALS